MKKIFLLLSFFTSLVFGQNPKKILSVPGSVSYNSWSCNGLQFYETYVESTNRVQLWRTDGTSNGTFPLTNFTGAKFASTMRDHAAVVGDIFYFTCINNGLYELWKSDGTMAGTVHVNISPLVTTGGVIRANSTHVFFASYSPFEELYSVNNTGQVTFLKRLKNSGAYTVLYDHACIFNDKLIVVQSVFTPQGIATNDNTFFISDGTPAGSTTHSAILDKLPGKLIPCGDEYILMELASFGAPHSLAKLPKLFNGIGDVEIFYTLGSGSNLKEYKTHPSTTYNTNGISTWQGNASIGDMVFLSGYSDIHGWELWKTDGTTSGTVLVKDINPGTGSGFAIWNGFTINGKFIFDGASPTGANRIYCSDGTTGGTAIIPQAPSGLGEFVCLYNEIAYFPSLTSTASGISSIWQTDGTVENTLPVTPFYMSPGRAPFGMVGNGNLVYPAYVNNGWQLSLINPNFKLWNGSADTDWGNPANWQGNTLPSTSENVLLPSNVPNYPIVNAGIDIHNLWLNWGSVSLANNAIVMLTGELSVPTNNINLPVNNRLIGNGSLHFTGSNDHIFDGTGTVNLPVFINGGDIIVSGGNKRIPQLNFQTANKVFLGNNDIDITTINGISGAGDDRFIVTNGTGRLILPAIGTASSTTALYPVGSNSASYTPVSIQNNGFSYQWNVRVIDSAYDSYSNVYPELPLSSAKTINAINKTWFINHQAGSSLLNPSIQFQWGETDELPGFNRADMKAGLYQSNWTYSDPGTAIGNDPYSFTYTAVPGFAAFTLTSESAIQNTYYADTDSDTYGDPGNSIQAPAPPPGYVSNNTDCNDGLATVYPGAIESCNGIDDDCDGQIDEGLLVTYYQDADNDGYGNGNVAVQACTIPVGYVSDNTDCNDGNSAIHPGADETCNGIDDNCNGSVDEGLALPVITAGNIVISEGNGGTFNAVFTVQLSSNYCQPVSLTYSTADSSAIAGQDYGTVSGQLLFPPNTTTQVISVPVYGDLLDEKNELFILQLNNIVNAIPGSESITCTINDDDPEPVAAISDVTVLENAGQALLTVTLSAPSGKSIRVKYKTINGTAVQPQDYVRINNGDITIPPGSTSMVIPVTIHDNPVAEPTEYFDVQITNLQNAVEGDGSGRVTILDGGAPITSRSPVSGHAEKPLSDNPGSNILIAHVFPNPHQGEFRLQVESPETGSAVIELFSADGRLVKAQNVLLLKETLNTVFFKNIRESILYYRVRLGRHIVNGTILKP